MSAITQMNDWMQAVSFPMLAGPRHNERKWSFIFPAFSSKLFHLVITYTGLYRYEGQLVNSVKDIIAVCYENHRKVKLLILKTRGTYT